MKDHRTNPLIQVHKQSIPDPKPPTPEQTRTTKGGIRTDHNYTSRQVCIYIPHRRARVVGKRAMQRYVHTSQEKEEDDERKRKNHLLRAKQTAHQVEGIELMQQVAQFEELIRQEINDPETLRVLKKEQFKRTNMYSDYLIQGIRRGLHIHPPVDYIMYLADFYRLTVKEIFSGIGPSDAIRIYEARERAYKDVIYI